MHDSGDTSSLSQNETSTERVSATASPTSEPFDLHVFGPLSGLIDASPFCVKAMVLLKMTGHPYTTSKINLFKAPKGKAPVLFHGDNVVPDTTFIRFYLERTLGFDFDEGCTDEQRGIAWAAEKLIEDNLYFMIASERWLIDENFNAGPRHYFDDVPAPLRPVIRTIVRRDVRAMLKKQGISRHSREEQTLLAVRGFEAIAQIIGDKDWLTGDTPCGADASVWAGLHALFGGPFRSPTANALASNAVLRSYLDRGAAKWFPNMPAL